MKKEIKSGVYLLRLRSLSGLSQKEFAKTFGVTRGYISQLENNRVSISIATFVMWCKYFNVSPKQIFFDDEWA